jgi:hypothetical protein
MITEEETNKTQSGMKYPLYTRIGEAYPKELPPFFK